MLEDEDIEIVFYSVSNQYATSKENFDVISHFFKWPRYIRFEVLGFNTRYRCPVVRDLDFARHLNVRVVHLVPMEIHQGDSSKRRVALRLGTNAHHLAIERDVFAGKRGLGDAFVLDVGKVGMGGEDRDGVGGVFRGL